MSQHLSKNIIANLLQAVITTLLLFILYRYISTQLGVAQFGIWSVVVATSSASNLANLGMSAGMTRFVARYLALDNPQMAAHMVETASITVAVVFSAALIGLYFPIHLILGQIFSSQELIQAQALLPYALISLVLNDLSMVFLSGLDGFQRMELRAIISILGQMLRLILTVVFVPVFGLLGLGVVQVLQAAVLLIASWAVLHRLLPQLNKIPTRWSYAAFRELLTYGINVQVTSLFQMLFAPLAKALMAKFGGASAAGYFEMANQVIQKARNLIVAANQAIVPAIAAMAETTPAYLERLYKENMRVLVFLVVPISSWLVLGAGIFSWLLTGQYHLEFIYLMDLLAVGWGINYFASPAYFSNLGTGDVSWNTLAHAVMGILTAVLGWGLGIYYDIWGVAVAYVVGLAVGSILLIVIFQKKHKIFWHPFQSREHLGVFLSGILTIIFGVWLNLYGRNISPVLVIVALLGLAVLPVVTAWFHPVRRMLWGRFVTIR